MTIQSEIQSLSPSALIELFVLDTTNLSSGGTVSYFHSGTNGLLQPIVWQGNTYLPLPIEAQGFNATGKGSPPRPTVRVANIQGIFSSLVDVNDGLIGSKITRKRTYAKFLDAVNFPGGVNPTADPTQYLPDDPWIIERKNSEDKYMIEWELASPFDVSGVKLPYRQVIQNQCWWVYRSSECGYVGTNYWDVNNNPVTVASQDVCAKTLTACKLRFPQPQNVPFGGFPGATVGP